MELKSQTLKLKTLSQEAVKWGVDTSNSNKQVTELVSLVNFTREEEEKEEEHVAFKILKHEINIKNQNYGKRSK